jgi:hypothetical protein
MTDDSNPIVDQIIVDIVRPNQIPEIEIVQIILSNEDATVLSDVVTVEGEATDDEELTMIQISVGASDFVDPVELRIDTETDYYWEIDVDTSPFPAGEYVIFARAQDSDGEYSLIDSIGVRIDNREPEAIIESIKPSIAYQGGTDMITLVGRGDMDGDDFDEARDIAQYEWVSNRDGPLGTDATLELTADELSVGVHTIQLRVMGANGQWSDAVNTMLTIKSSKGSAKEDEKEWWEVPGMEAPAIIAALAAVMLLYRRRR